MSAAAAVNNVDAPALTPTTGPAVDAVRELLGQRVMVQTPDGRRIEGEFQCLDPQGNLILGNAYEQLQGHQLPAAAAAAAAAQPGDAAAAKAGRDASGAATASSEQQTPDQQQQQPSRPGERALGMVLVPREQQKEVSVLAMPSQRAAIEKMVKEAVEAEEARGGAPPPPPPA